MYNNYIKELYKTMWSRNLVFNFNLTLSKSLRIINKCNEERHKVPIKVIRYIYFFWQFRL